MKSYISSYLNLEPYRENLKVFKSDILNEDDTIQDVLNKLAIHCPNEKVIYTHIYAWYKDKEQCKSFIGFNIMI